MDPEVAVTEPWKWNPDAEELWYTAEDGRRYMIDSLGPETGRRIVACVNACEGIPTESLETGMSRGVFKDWWDEAGENVRKMQAFGDNAKRNRLRKYQVRTCHSMHECLLCDSAIGFGQLYFDGGLKWRAHYDCVEGGKAR
jgi:hypothetical protein